MANSESTTFVLGGDSSYRAVIFTVSAGVSPGDQRGTSVTNTNMLSGNAVTWGLTTDSSKSGIIVEIDNNIKMIIKY